MPPRTRAQARAAEAPTLLDALARAPAAAALVVGALKRAPDRRALRLAHPQLRDAVNDATTKLNTVTGASDTVALCPPTARRWPRLEELRISRADAAVTERLGAETWGHLRSLHLDYDRWSGATAARALAAALLRMPALRALALRYLPIAEDAAAALFSAAVARATPQLRSLALDSDAELTPAAARALAAAGWRLEELDIMLSHDLGDAGVAALAAAPAFALRRLDLRYCGLGIDGLAAIVAAPWPLQELDLSGNGGLGAGCAAALVAAPRLALRRLALGGCNMGAPELLALAAAPWPLEELDVGGGDYRAAAAGPALAALSQRAGLRALITGRCKLSAAGFAALVEGAWPSLTMLDTQEMEVDFGGSSAAFGAAAFAGFPRLETLQMAGTELGEAGAHALARALARRRWPRLRTLGLSTITLNDFGRAELFRRGRNLDQNLDLRWNRMHTMYTRSQWRWWAPALVELVDGHQRG